jgi:hypothetical protein
MSEIKYLDTNVDTCNQEDTCLCYKYDVTPKSVDIAAHFTCDNRLAKYIHIQRIDNDWDDTADTKRTKFGNQVNTVTEYDHDSDDQDTIINDSFYAK